MNLKELKWEHSTQDSLVESLKRNDLWNSEIENIIKESQIPESWSAKRIINIAYYMMYNLTNCGEKGWRVFIHNWVILPRVHEFDTYSTNLICQNVRFFPTVEQGKDYIEKFDRGYFSVLFGDNNESKT